MPPEVVEVEVEDDEVVLVEQVPVHDAHHEQVVAACAGAIGNAIAAAATVAKTYFFISFPPKENCKTECVFEKCEGARSNQDS